MMDEAAIKLECLKLAQTGSPDATVKSAQIYYDWITQPDKPKRGRPPKSGLIKALLRRGFLLFCVFTKIRYNQLAFLQADNSQRNPLTNKGNLGRR
jgi:hypothetical protein